MVRPVPTVTPSSKAHTHPTGPWHHCCDAGRHSLSCSTIVVQAWRTPLLHRFGTLLPTSAGRAFPGASPYLKRTRRPRRMRADRVFLGLLVNSETRRVFLKFHGLWFHSMTAPSGGKKKARRRGLRKLHEIPLLGRRSASGLMRYRFPAAQPAQGKGIAARPVLGARWPRSRITGSGWIKWRA